MIQKKAFRQRLFRIFPKPSVALRWVGLGFIILLLNQSARAQGVPQVGSQLEFAGVTVHLTDVTQHLIQQEAEVLYVNRTLVASRLDRIHLYLPIIKPLLAQHSLSDDFLFLALYESALHTDVHSSPFWALEQTNLGELRMDAFIDERLHPVRSTLAAINRLKRLYQQTPNWVDVVNQYHRMPHADTVRTTRQAPVTGKTYALTDARDEFLIRLLASKIVLERALSLYHPQRPTVLFPYGETAGKSLAEIADACQVDAASIAPYNAWLKGSRIPEHEDYTVYIPTTLERYAELKRKTDRAEINLTASPDAGFPALQKTVAEPNQEDHVFYRINGKKGI